MKPTIIILAAGKNTRFFPFNNGPHKGTLSLHGEPIIFKTLRSLEKHGFRDIVIVVSEKDYQNNGIAKLLENFHSELAINLVLQTEATGMGDAVLAAKDFVKNSYFVIRPGLINAGEIADKMLQKNSELALCGITTSQPWLYGMFHIEDDKVVGLVEKPKRGEEPSNIKIEAIYLLNQDFLGLLEDIPKEEYSFEIAIDKLLKKQAVDLVKYEEEFPSLKLPWQLFDFQKAYFDELPSFKHPTAEIAETAVIDETNGSVYIDEGAKIGHAARIVGPTYVGKNALVGDFSFVRQSSIEPGAVVGANSELVRSIIMKDSTFHFSYVADSIIGENVQIGAGIITANKRLDRGVVKPEVKKERLDSNRKALGAIIGHEAKLGIGVRTMPGVMIGSKSVIYPGIVVKDNVESGEILTK